MMNDYNTLVEDNLGLVNEVIKENVHDINKIGIFTYQDLLQIGRIGLWQAARGFKENGKAIFSTYAYVTIRNKIFDALEYSSARTKHESVMAPTTILELMHAENENDPFNSKTGIYDLLEAIQSNTSSTITKGIEALKLYAQGLSYSDIAVAMDAKNTNNVAAWISKARKFLKCHPKILALREEIM